MDLGLQIPKGCNETETNCSLGAGQKGMGLTLQQKGLRLCLRKRFPTKRWFSAGTVYREAGAAPSLHGYGCSFDRPMSGLVWAGMTLP